MNSLYLQFYPWENTKLYLTGKALIKRFHVSRNVSIRETHSQIGEFFSPRRHYHPLLWAAYRIQDALHCSLYWEGCDESLLQSRSSLPPNTALWLEDWRRGTDLRCDQANYTVWTSYFTFYCLTFPTAKNGWYVPTWLRQKIDVKSFSDSFLWNLG